MWNTFFFFIKSGVLSESFPSYDCYNKHWGDKHSREWSALSGTSGTTTRNGSFMLSSDCALIRIIVQSFQVVYGIDDIRWITADELDSTLMWIVEVFIIVNINHKRMKWKWVKGELWQIRRDQLSENSFIFLQVWLYWYLVMLLKRMFCCTWL